MIFKTQKYTSTLTLFVLIGVSGLLSDESEHRLRPMCRTFSKSIVTMGGNLIRQSAPRKQLT